MTQEELINYLHTELSTQRTFYTWIIGILITIVIFAVGFNFWQQNKLADKKVEKLKDDLAGDIKKDLQNAQNKIKILKKSINKQSIDIFIIQVSMGAQNFAVQAMNKQTIACYNQLVMISLLVTKIPNDKVIDEQNLRNFIIGINVGFKILNSNNNFKVTDNKYRDKYLSVVQNIQKFMNRKEIKHIMEKDYNYREAIKNIQSNIDVVTKMDFSNK